MTWLIFIGDMLIMLFMIGLVVWVVLRVNQRTVDKSSRIPLDDERHEQGMRTEQDEHDEDDEQSSNK